MIKYIKIFIYFIWFLFVYFLFCFIDSRLSSCTGLNLDGLGEVGAHESLEVEVGELVLLAKLQEGSKLGIRVDLATIGGVLKIVGADVSVDVAGHSRARHLGTLLLAKERGELVTDAGGLDKTAGGTVSGLALAAGVHLSG